MKVYTVTPGEDFITVSDGRKIEVGGGISWGVATDPRAADLSRALINDATHNPVDAMRYALRFKYRVVVNWNASAPNGITEDEIKEVLAAIKKTEDEMRPIINKIGNERPPPLGTFTSLQGSDIDKR